MGFQFSGYQGPGTDDAHLPHEHIEELREFFQRGLPQESFHFRDTWIVLELLILVPFLSVLGVLKELLEDLLRIPDHGPDLVKVERLTAQSNALLLVEDGWVSPCST